MSEKIYYLNASELLLKIVPEINDEKFEERRNQWNKNLDGYNPYEMQPHLVFADHLDPYIDKLVVAGDRGADLKRVFDFLEEVASSEDKGLGGLMDATICSHILGKPGLFKKLEKYMGPNTLAFCKKNQKHYKTDEEYYSGK